MPITKLLEIREQIKRIYNRYSMFINPALKFIIVFISILIINSKIGYMNALTGIAMEILISLICMFLPAGAISLALSAVIAGNLYGLSPVAAGGMCGFFFILYLIFFRFVPKDGVLLIAVPLLTYMKIPYVIPVIAGLALTPVSYIAILSGLAVYFVISRVNASAAEMIVLAKEDPAGLIKDMFVGALREEALIVTGIAFLATIITVYIIRRLSVDYAPYIAIAAGTLLNIVIMVAGSLKFDLKPHMDIVSIIFGSIATLLISAIAQMFILTVDYARTEYVQYQDDDYYYYVKAVPKIKVTAHEVSVKRINAQKAKKSKEVD